MARKPDVGQLRNDAAFALERGKLDKAIELYQALEDAEPTAPGWPKKIGETHRRAGNTAAAVAAFERAAQKYALNGFLVQAIAVCKMILQIEPEHSATQIRLAELMPKPALRPDAVAKPRAETSPLVYEDDSDVPMREPSSRPNPARAAPEPAAPRTTMRERDLAASAARARSEAPPAARTSTRERDLAAAAARARNEGAPARTSMLDRDVAEAATRARAEAAARARNEAAARARSEAMRAREDAAARDRDIAAAAARVVDETPTAIPRPVVAPSRPTPPAIPGAMPRAHPAPSPAATRAATDRPVPPLGEPPRRAPKPSLPAVIVDRKPTVDIPPGGGLDQIDLSTLVPGAVPIHFDDGTFSGVNVLPLGGDDLEFSLDDAEPATDRQPGYAARRALLTTPLFPQVSPRVLEQMIAQMSLLVLEPDEILFREGETGNELFVISEGEVAVESHGIGELARLGPSAFFGEIALVTDLPRSATIRAVSRVELLAIDRAVIRDASKGHPEIVTVLLRFVRDRLIDRITRTSELFAPFTDEERRALSARFELVEVVPDAVLITQGERADGLYLVVAGKVEVWRDGEAALATLGSGDVFGELSLLAGGGSIANVRATTRVLALRMPASTFQEVIMTHPQVLAYLGELAVRRRPEVQGDEFVDLHLDLLV